MRQTMMQCVVCVGLIVCVVVLNGCRDTEGQQARERADAVEARLQNAEAQHQATQGERDALKLEVSSLVQSMETLKAQLSSAAQLKEQVNTLMAERDSAVASLKDQAKTLLAERDAAIAQLNAAQTTINGLTSQLQAQVDKLSQLDEQNKKLQALIDELKSRLGSGITLPGFPSFR
jgi:chromosome segregation ATPase